MLKNKTNALLILLLATLLFGACKKLLPTDKDAFNAEAGFTQTIYQPILGRTTVMSNNFNSQGSSLPLTFKIVGIRNSDGMSANELLKSFPVSVWKKAYDGSEKTLAEIEGKRVVEEHPFFEIRQHSGELIMWSEATSNIVKSFPDSGYVFDVEVSNSGGRKYYNGLKLQPYKERAYEPNNINPLTGTSTGGNIFPTRIDNIVGEASSSFLNFGDVNISFHRKGDGNSLSFKFLDTLSNPIDPAKFKLTNWAKLIHGFNMKMTTAEVTYDVAYPIPCVFIPTPYTTADGRRASVNFLYDRMGFGGVRQVARLGFDFTIFQKGSWDIIIWFKTDNPKFTDD